MSVPYAFAGATGNLPGSQLDSNFTYLDNADAGSLKATNNLSDVVSVSTSRTNLGLGTAATANTGTSGGAVPLLNGNNAFSGSNTFITQSPGDNSTKGATTAFVTNAVATVGVVRGYISGAILSTAGSSATFGITSGVAADSTNVAMLALASAYTKTTSVWAVGSANGALDTGAIASTTWYHVYLIKRVDTSVVDILISLSATSPTLPTSYTLFRRIGSMLTDGSSHWVAFTQVGDLFIWVAPFGDLSSVTIGVSLTLETLTVPTNVSVGAIGRTKWSAGTSGNAVATVLSVSETGGGAGTGMTSWVVGSTLGAFGFYNIQTNLNGQIYFIADQAACSLTESTDGWVDSRGKNS